MDNLVLTQKRVKFSSPGRERQEESQGITGKTRQTWWGKQYFSGQTSHDYEEGDSNYAAAVAAAAFAVHSLEQAEIMKREALEASRTRAKSKKDEIIGDRPSSSKLTRMFSNKEAKGEVSRKRSVGPDERTTERANLAKQASRSSSVRRPDPYPTQRATSRGRSGIESKADSWEKDQMRKVQNRYEKTKSTILEWENKKKLQAKLKMEKRKSLLEQRRAQNMQHYHNKMMRIEQIAGGARALLEEKRRNEESAVKETAKKITSRGNIPVKFLCFTCS